jgi:putative addiction module component (TIGR02574 family)
MASTSELRKLDVRTRLAIIDELWDSIVEDTNGAPDAEALPLDDATRALLDERMREYRADPSSGIPWDVVRARLADRAR